MNNKNFSRDAAISLLLAGLFILILALISLNKGEERSPLPVSVQGSTESAIDLVNKHLRQTYDSQEMDRKHAENLNTLTAPTIAKAPKVVQLEHFDELPLTFDQESVNELVGQDLRLFAHDAITKKTLSEQIQQEVIDDLVHAAEEDNYKKALANAVIQKARNQGYEIQVDDQYKIKSVKKLKQNDGKSIFDPVDLPNR